jgi:soluble cytochrome b562
LISTGLFSLEGEAMSESTATINMSGDADQARREREAVTKEFNEETDAYPHGLKCFIEALDAAAGGEKKES